MTCARWTIIQSTLAMCCAAAVSYTTSALDIDRFQLENGVHVVIAHLPDVPLQSTFTYLPVHLGNDGPDRAQWSHLLEHLVIGSTDPTPDSKSGITVNGETMHHLQRLDTYANPEAWEEALRHHAQWMKPMTFTMELLEQEMPRIATEEVVTVDQGYTFKFAIAAWNQIVRHGREHAAVHGDVASATVEQANAYAQSRMPVDDTVWFATVGPKTIDEAKQAITQTLGVINPRNATAPKAARPVRFWSGDVTATWDIDNRHLLRWWRLPDTDPGTLAMSNVVGQMIQTELGKSAEILSQGAIPVVFFSIPTPEGCIFMIDTSMKKGSTEEIIRTGVERAVRKVLSSPHLELWSTTIASRTSLATRLAQMREFDQRKDGFSEAQWLITAMNEEFAIGATTPDIQAHYASLKAGALEQFQAAMNTSINGSLLLEPNVNHQNTVDGNAGDNTMR